jgi:hypothetical protein
MCMVTPAVPVVAQRRVRAARRLLAAGVSVLALLPPAARAHLPESYGRLFVAVPSREAAPVAVITPDSALLRQQVETLETALEDVTEAYSPAAADPLTALGQAWSQLGDPRRALEHYGAALQSRRINDGLLAPTQLPLLRAMAASHAALGDRAAQQARWRQAFRVHGMGHGVLADEALRDSLAYFRIARERYIDPTQRADTAAFLEALIDNDAAYAAQVARDDAGYALVEALAISQLRNLYLLLGSDFSQVAPAGDAADAAQANLLRRQALAYGDGLDLLRDLLLRAARQPAAVRARLQLRLANWHQWNSHWQSARGAYAEVFRLLSSAPQDRALRERLASPALLPEDPGLWESLQAPGVPTRGIVRASLRVSARGDASRVRVDSEGETSPALAGRLRRILADSHFRPALRDGTAEAGELRDLRYLILD